MNSYRSLLSAIQRASMRFLGFPNALTVDASRPRNHFPYLHQAETKLFAYRVQTLNAEFERMDH